VQYHRGVGSNIVKYRGRLFKEQGQVVLEASCRDTGCTIDT
jgi:hypothetical protein